MIIKPLFQPFVMIWADSGTLPINVVRFYRPGTASASLTETFIRIDHNAVVKSLSIRAVTGPGGLNTDTWTIRKNGIDTLLTVSLTGVQTSNINNTVSVTFLSGDLISLKVSSSLLTTTSDTVIQVDIF